MNNYKPKDIITVIIASLIFVGAIIFMLEGGSDKKSKSSDLVSEPDFVYEYDDKVFDKIKSFVDYSSINPTNLCKGNLLTYEDPLPEGSLCYALAQLGLLEEGGTKTKIDFSDFDKLTSDSEKIEARKTIVESFKLVLENYYSKNKAYPSNSDSKQLLDLLKVNGALQDFVEITGTAADPGGDDTRMCYVKKTDKTYWLYVVNEPNPAPSECTDTDPAKIDNAEDFSIR